MQLIVRCHFNCSADLKGQAVLELFSSRNGALGLASFADRSHSVSKQANRVEPASVAGLDYINVDGPTALRTTPDCSSPRMHREGYPATPKREARKTVPGYIDSGC